MKETWTACKFEGNPPPQYKSWQEFIELRAKVGVYIRAATFEDFQPSEPQA